MRWPSTLLTTISVGSPNPTPFPQWEAGLTDHVWSLEDCRAGRTGFLNLMRQSRLISGPLPKQGKLDQSDVSN